MKRIYNNSDIQINLKTISGITDKFIIKFFTTNKEFFIRKTNENVYTVDDEKYIKLNWSELQTIGDGVLNYVLNNIKDDSDYDDGEYNNTISKTTNYYICSNFKVDPETDKSISEIIAELTNKVDAEITRSTNKDGEHDNAISNLNNDLEIEETARKDADTQLQNSLVENEFVVSAALNDLKSSKANIGDSYTKAESDAKYLTEHQDISKLASKSELDTLQTNLTKEIEDESARARAKEITLSGQIYDIDQSLSTFEKKTDHDADISDLDDRVTALVANTYNKTQINNALENLEHNLQTNIDKKANISELENETTARQNADAQLQSNIDRKANIEDVYDKQTANSTFVTKEELQEILKKINGGEY